MSRVTSPVTKLFKSLRTISSSANASHPSALLDSNARASRYLPRNVKDLRAECRKRDLKTNGSKSELVDRLTAHDLVGSHAFHTMGIHRPTSRPLPRIYQTGNLMQGFQTSAPKQFAHDSSTIDFFFFPQIPEPVPTNPFKIRVPLLPDNYNPDRSPNSVNALETLDDALPRPEISIIANRPEDVVPATITEVVGNDGTDVDLSQLTSAYSGPVEDVKEPGILRDLWNGLLEDIFGPKHPKPTV